MTIMSFDGLWIIREEVVLLLINLCVCLGLAFKRARKALIILLIAAIIQYIFIEWNSLLSFMFGIIYLI